MFGKSPDFERATLNIKIRITVWYHGYLIIPALLIVTGLFNGSCNGAKRSLAS